MLALARRAVRRPRRSRRRRRRPRSRFRTRRSTTSRSRTCSATSTTPVRRWPSSRASSGRVARSRTSSSACPAGSGGRSGISTSASASRRGSARLPRLVRRRPVPRPLDPRVLRALAARAPARALARGGHHRRAGAAHEPRRRGGDLGDPEREAGVLRTRAGRLARLRDAAARSLHRLASLLRRRRWLPRGRACPGIGSGSPCSRSSSPWASAPTRSTSSPVGRFGRPFPRRSSSPSRVVSIAAACAIGIAVAIGFSLWILPLIAIGAFLVPAYNLELFGGRFHSDLWFALAWGAFPVVTGSVACAGTIRGSRPSSQPPGRPSSRSPSGGSRLPCGTSDVMSSR